MWSTPAGHEVELGRLLDELDTELGLLLLEDDLLVEVDVLVDVEDGTSDEELLEEELLSKDDVALLDGMQPTTSNDVTTATSKIFFLIIKKLFDLF